MLRSVASLASGASLLITILGELGINLGPLIAGAGIVGVAIGFGAQSLVKDFLSGIFMLVEDQYGVGDIVDVGEATGTVEAVSLRTTRLRDVNGTVWHVPNGADPAGRQQVPAVGARPARRRRSPTTPTSHHAERGDQATSPTGCGRTTAWAGQILEEPEVWGVERLGPDGITIRLVVKTLPGPQFDIMRELRGRIKVALDDAGVEMPSAGRTIVLQGDGSLPDNPAPPRQEAGRQTEEGPPPRRPPEEGHREEGGPPQAELITSLVLARDGRPLGRPIRARTRGATRPPCASARGFDPRRWPREPAMGRRKTSSSMMAATSKPARSSAANRLEV